MQFVTKALLATFGALRDTGDCEVHQPDAALIASGRVVLADARVKRLFVDGCGCFGLLDELDEFHAYVADGTFVVVGQEEAVLLEATPKKSIGAILIFILFS